MRAIGHNAALSRTANRSRRGGAMAGAVDTRLLIAAAINQAIHKRVDVEIVE